MDCHGTEPFWSAEVSDTAIKFYNMDDDPSYPITSVSAAAGFTLDFMQIYSNSNGPVAVVTSNSCSDAMSDFIYPKEIILFTPTGTHYGCCGVGVEN